jgi:formamidopyrimidine-DNA glycosylase
VPELPEVETVVRSLARALKGETIRNSHFFSRFVTQGDFLQVSASLSGKKILEVSRTGKHIFMHLASGVLHIHLGMTGKLLWQAEPGPYTRAVLELEHGTLLYDDIRQFGRVNYYPELPPHLVAVGPDALRLSFDEFYHRLHARNSAIKALLLNQRFVSGIGNIYADEALFDAGIHPRTRSRRLSKQRIHKLFDSIQRILISAIDHRGSSISDYVDAAGAKGSFQMLHRVYGKAGEPCPLCRQPIRRIVIAQRGTHYCPRCQRA